MLNVVVSGAGIGGVTAALALRRAGHNVTVLEQASEAGEVGAGLQVPPNAGRLLAHLGVSEQLRAVAVEPVARIARRWADGSVIYETPLGSTVSERYGAPYLVVHRVDLHRVLMDAALEQDAPGNPVSFRFGQQVADVTRTDTGPVEIHTADGGIFCADAVVGADGIHSRVRELIGEQDSPRFSGELAWRGLIPSSDLTSPELLEWSVTRPVTTVWLGPSQHVVHYPLRGGVVVNLGAIVPGSEVVESYATVGDPQDMCASFNGWDPRLLELLRSATQVRLWPLFDRRPLAWWARGQVCLVGDACHPMLPYQAQGAAQAIEDAWVLADLLKDARAEAVADAMAAYARARSGRATAIQAASHGNKVFYHLPDGAQQAERDARMTTMSGNTSLPYEWLWGAAPTASPPSP